VPNEYDDGGASSLSSFQPTPGVAGGRRPSSVGKWILLGAVLVAALIILGGVLIAAERRESAERERRLQQRFLELQQQED
jgi:hypothetical protein